MFLGFYFGFTYPSFGAEEGSNPGTSMGADQKNLKQKPKEQERQSLVYRKLIYSHSIPAKYHRKHCGLTPPSMPAKGLQYPTGVVTENPSKKPGLSFLLADNK